MTEASAAAAAAATLKVLLVGDSGVGKSSLLLSFVQGVFDEAQSTTIGIDFKVKRVEVLDRADGQPRQVVLQLWDTAGQERFRTLTSSYYRGAHAVVFVYDVTAPRTFDGLARWLEEVHAYCTGSDDGRVVYLLIGNKTDKCDGAAGAGGGGVVAGCVSEEEARAFARQHHMLFALTSAKTRHGVADAFDELARAAYDELQAEAHAATTTTRHATTLSDADDAAAAATSRDGRGGTCC